MNDRYKGHIDIMDEFEQKKRFIQRLMSWTNLSKRKSLNLKTMLLYKLKIFLGLYFVPCLFGNGCQLKINVLTQKD